MTILTTHPLFERLINGRAWIGLVAFALIGIVTMQLGLLKLNAGIGRALEHEGALQRENAALSVENSEVAAGDSIELQAAHMGMRLVPAGSLRFLSAQSSRSEIGQALAALSARASATSAAATATASQPASSESEPSSSAPAAAGESEASATGATGGEASTSASTTSSETSHTGTSAASEAPAGGEHASSSESGASEAAAAPPSGGESGGSSANPGG